MKDRVDRIMNEEEARRKEWSGELEKLKVLNNSLTGQIHIKNQEINALREINNSLNQATTNPC